MGKVIGIRRSDFRNGFNHNRRLGIAKTKGVADSR
jgi:hypothetical protein